MEQLRLDQWLSSARLTAPVSELTIEGADPVYPTPVPVGEAAAVALGLAAAGAADLYHARTGRSQRATVEVAGAAASLLSFLYQRFEPPASLGSHDATATVDLYEAGSGGWIHLHGGFPHGRTGTLELLGCADDKEAVASAVAGWDAGVLEDELAERGLCGARARTPEEWLLHPHGRAIDELPAVTVNRIGPADPAPLPPGERPLSGVRVVDLTRVLAGPTCGRTLASHGAEVLLASGPDVPNIEPFLWDTSHGKRSAWLDLDARDGRERLLALAGDADVFAQSYRPGSMRRRGLGPEELADLRPGIVYVDISCYGRPGPFADRPGWEQLAQTTSGMAVLHGEAGRPQLVPAAACDYTTGYLAAFGVQQALLRRISEGGSWHVEVSLCQTAAWILRANRRADPAAATGLGAVERFTTTCETERGRLVHLGPVAHLSVTDPHWSLPSALPGTHPAEWATGGPA